MKIIKEALSWIGCILTAFAIALFINVFIFQPVQVEGHSMEANLHDKDRVLINKFSHILRQEPEYGDIVMIDSRVDRARTLKDDVTDNLKYNLITMLVSGKQDEVYWIKRVIGKPGDVIEVKDGEVVRNGTVLEEPYIKEPMLIQKYQKITVPENSLFVMGDNRNNSKDSRYIGCIPLDHVMGKYIVKF